MFGNKFVGKAKRLGDYIPIGLHLDRRVAIASQMCPLGPLVPTHFAFCMKQSH